jgi:hypothetical protein
MRIAIKYPKGRYNPKSISQGCKPEMLKNKVYTVSALHLKIEYSLEGILSMEEKHSRTIVG